MSALSKNAGFGTSGNPKLSALRVNGEPQFLALIAKALQLNHGNVRNAAKALRVSRNTLTKWIAHYPILQTELSAARVQDFDEFE